MSLPIDPTSEMIDRARRELCPCQDCFVPTTWRTQGIGEFYMVSDDVWDKVAPDDPHEMDFYLCIGCLEGRLERELSSEDFLACPLNFRTDLPRSPRLQARMNDEGFREFCYDLLVEDDQ